MIIGGFLAARDCFGRSQPITWGIYSAGLLTNDDKRVFVSKDTRMYDDGILPKIPRDVLAKEEIKRTYKRYVFFTKVKIGYLYYEYSHYE